MLGAFQHAAELAPDNFAYVYRHAEAYADLEKPQWEQALQAWSALESRAQPGIEQETILLQAANVLLKLKQIDRARVLLARVNTPVLLKQKKTLLDQLPSKAEK
jgi:outer membrane protein assembly factor BamD (BamD/ComL family)